MPSGHVDPTKLRPLSTHAYGVLVELSYGVLGARRVNPGVRLRLLRGGLAEPVDDGTLAIRITPKGREELRAWKARTEAKSAAERAERAKGVAGGHTP